MMDQECSCNLLFRVIFFLAMFVTVMAVAQETPVAAEPGTAQEQQAEQTQVTEDAAEGTPKTFNPTEEISEDHPVEFPVDI